MQYTASPSWLEGHPRTQKAVQSAQALYRYLVSFQWVVDIVRWMITTGGNIAESAFLLATVYVTINVVAHKLVAWALPVNVISTLNQISVIAFSVLPELIVASAIAVTFDHYKFAWGTKKWYAWIWGGLYTIPTVIFIYMTVVTITSFVSLEAINVDYQATGAMLVTRCLAGWGYGMLQTLFFKVGKHGYNVIFDTLKKQVASLSATLKERDSAIASMQEHIATLEERIATQEQELIATRVALASKRMTRRSGESATSPDESAIPQSGSNTSQSGSNTSQGRTSAQVPAQSEEKRAALKEQLRIAMMQEGKVNLRKISNEIDMGYSTARKYAPALIDEITGEHPALPKIALVG